MGSLLKAGLKRYLLFPGDILPDVLVPILVVIIISSVYASRELPGYGNMVLYVAAANLAYSLQSWIRARIEGKIRLGEFQVMLTKPVEPARFEALLMLSRELLPLAVSLLVFLWLYGQLGGKNLHVVLFLIFLGWLFYFLLSSGIAYFAVFTNTTWAMEVFLVSIPMTLFGGSFIPLELLPDWVRVVATYLPFKYFNEAVGLAVLGKEVDVLPAVLWTGAALLFERLSWWAAKREMVGWGG